MTLMHLMTVLCSDVGVALRASGWVSIGTTISSTDKAESVMDSVHVGSYETSLFISKEILSNL